MCLTRQGIHKGFPYNPFPSTVQHPKTQQFGLVIDPTGNFTDFFHETSMNINPHNNQSNACSSKTKEEKDICEIRACLGLFSSSICLLLLKLCFSTGVNDDFFIEENVIHAHKSTPHSTYIQAMLLPVWNNKSHIV